MQNFPPSLFLKFSLLLWFLFLMPSFVFALAGWGEVDHTYYYTPDIPLETGEPSDMCASGPGLHQTCLYLFKNQGENYRRSEFINLPALTSINLPSSGVVEYIFVIVKFIKRTQNRQRQLAVFHF